MSCVIRRGHEGSGFASAGAGAGASGQGQIAGVARMQGGSRK